MISNFHVHIKIEQFAWCKHASQANRLSNFDSHWVLHISSLMPNSAKLESINWNYIMPGMNLYSQDIEKFDDSQNYK